MQLEQRIEDSLAVAVKQSVKQMHDCLVGDKKTEVPALFHVTLALEKNQRLELKPALQVGTPECLFIRPSLKMTFSP